MATGKLFLPSKHSVRTGPLPKLLYQSKSPATLENVAGHEKHLSNLELAGMTPGCKRCLHVFCDTRAAQPKPE